MAFKFFVVPMQDSSSAEAELNAFLASHKILAVDRRWVDQGTSSFWSLCVDYLDTASSSALGGRRQDGRQKIDYRERLPPEKFVVFARLRDLRKQVAQAEAVPVYTIFTNDQLAQMLQLKATTKAGLEKIAGVGEARIEKYGPRFLEFLQQQWGGDHETSGKPV